MSYLSEELGISLKRKEALWDIDRIIDIYEGSVNCCDFYTKACSICNNNNEVIFVMHFINNLQNIAVNNCCVEKIAQKN